MLKILYSITALLGVVLVLTELRVYGTLTGRSMGVMVIVLVLWLIDVVRPKQEPPTPSVKKRNISFELKGSGWKEVTHDDR